MENGRENTNVNFPFYVRNNASRSCVIFGARDGFCLKLGTDDRFVRDSMINEKYASVIMQVTLVNNDEGLVRFDLSIIRRVLYAFELIHDY